MEPFFIQYEKRMEYMRQKLVQVQKYRLRMYALSSLNFTPIRTNRYLERKKNLFTERDAQTCSCIKTKKPTRHNDGPKTMQPS